MAGLPSLPAGASTLWGYIPYQILAGTPGYPGAPGAQGAVGPYAGFLQNDRQGRASIQTSADAENTSGIPVNGATALTLLNALAPVFYTTEEFGNPPYRTPITQASILSALQTYADGADELGPFEVDGLASGTGTIELESLAGFLVSAVQGLGFQPQPGNNTAGQLQSSGFIVFTGASSDAAAAIGITSDGTPVVSVANGSAESGVLMTHTDTNVSGLSMLTNTIVQVGLSSTEEQGGTLQLTGGTGVMTITSTSLLGTYNGSAIVAVGGGNDPLVGMTSATEPLDVSYFKPRELSLSATGDQGQTTARIDFLGGDGTEARLTLAVGEAQTIVLQANGEYGAGQLIIGNGSKTAVLIDGNAGLLDNASDETPIFPCHTESAQVSIDNALFSVARIVQPAGVYSIPASAVAKAFIVAINDRSSPVDVVLPTGVPNGTLVYVKSEIAGGEDITISVDGGGLINDSATQTISLGYGSQGCYFAADLGQWFTI